MRALCLKTTRSPVSTSAKSLSREQGEKFPRNLAACFGKMLGESEGLRKELALSSFESWVEGDADGGRAWELVDFVSLLMV
jgi:hypothetical protein